MSEAIRKAVVIGAGSMGSGIAAQFANAGIPVVLLDIAIAGDSDRKALARAGIARQLKAGGFMSPSAARDVTPGNIDDDLTQVADADWIVEAIVEDLALKQDLFRRLEATRRPGSIVSSNTSTIARSLLMEGLPESLRRDFVITHFFNPPRHMALLEIVSGADNPADVVERVTHAGSVQLGKTVVACRDTAGFIANRLGCYWMAVAAIEAIQHGLTVEEADAVAGAPFGVPRTGVFGLFDLVGIDLVPLVWASLMKALPDNDGIQGYDLPAHPVFRHMIAAGLIGRKAKQGFYRMSPAGVKVREVLDLQGLDYRAEAPAFAGGLPAAANEGTAGLRELCLSDTPSGRYAWAVLKRVVAYASTVAAEVADDVAVVDTALQLGYSWKLGPFALADAVGASWIVSKMQAEGERVPALLKIAASRGGFYRDAGGIVTRTDGSDARRAGEAGVLKLADVASGTSPMRRNESAVLWDIGEGVGCLELKTKMNVFDPAVFEMIGEIVTDAHRELRALVIGNDHPRAFSAGADLAFILGTIESGDLTQLARFISAGQAAFSALKYAPFPVVGAAFGLALGGGCEVLLHCDAIVSHAELSAGLPETTVGLVPGWGGCTQMLLRAARADGRPRGPVAVSQQVFDLIRPAAISSSAASAKEMGLLRAQDQIVMNRSRVLFDARSRAIGLAEAGYQPPQEAWLSLPGRTGLAALRNGIDGEQAAGRLSASDAAIADVLATVLTGGNGADPLVPVAEQAVYRLELDALIELAGTTSTRTRIEQMLRGGKPTR